MKKTFLIFFVSLLAFANPSFSQNEKKDYLDFNEVGDLTSFKKTAPDGSWIELHNKVHESYRNRYLLSIRRSNGAMIELYLNTYVSSFRSKNYFYKTYVEKASSFDSFLELKDLDYLTGPGSCIIPDGTVLYYDDEGRINTVLYPLAEKGDYAYLYTKLSVEGKYYEKEQITDEMISFVNKVRRTFDNCVMEMSVNSGKVLNGTISYPDGSSYSGGFELPDVDAWSLWYWVIGTSTPRIKYSSGVLTTASKEFKAYEDGEYSEFETIRYVQQKEKQAAEEKAKAERDKKTLAELNKKYGEKYVSAMLKGQLILGTPEELFLLGMSVNAYKSYTSAEPFYRSGSTTIYHVYGWRVDMNRYTAMTNKAYLGDIKFVNGKLTSVLK